MTPGAGPRLSGIFAQAVFYMFSVRVTPSYYFRQTKNRHPGEGRTHHPLAVHHCQCGRAAILSTLGCLVALPHSGWYFRRVIGPRLRALVRNICSGRFLHVFSPRYAILFIFAKLKSSNRRRPGPITRLQYTFASAAEPQCCRRSPALWLCRTVAGPFDV